MLLQLFHTTVTLHALSLPPPLMCSRKQNSGYDPLLYLTLNNSNQCFLHVSCSAFPEQFYALISHKLPNKEVIMKQHYYCTSQTSVMTLKNAKTT